MRVRGSIPGPASGTLATLPVAAPPGKPAARRPAGAPLLAAPIGNHGQGSSWQAGIADPGEFRLAPVVSPLARGEQRRQGSQQLLAENHQERQGREVSRQVPQRRYFA